MNVTEKTRSSGFRIVAVAVKWVLAMCVLWWVYAGMFLSLRAVLAHLRREFGDAMQLFLTPPAPDIIGVLDMGNSLLLVGALACLGVVLLFSLAEIQWGRKLATTVLAVGVGILLGAYCWALFVILFPFVNVPAYYPQ